MSRDTPVRIDDIRYPSIKAAAEDQGVSVDTVTRRCKSIDQEWVEWNYAQKTKSIEKIVFTVFVVSHPLVPGKFITITRHPNKISGFFRLQAKESKLLRPWYSVTKHEDWVFENVLETTDEFIAYVKKETLLWSFENNHIPIFNVPKLGKQIIYNPKTGTFALGIGKVASEIGIHRNNLVKKANKYPFLKTLMEQY